VRRLDIWGVLLWSLKARDQNMANKSNATWKAANFALAESAKSSRARLQTHWKETRCCAFSGICNVEAPDDVRSNSGNAFRREGRQLANEGHFGSMVSYQNYQVRQVPIAEAVNRLKLVPPNGEMVQTARDVDISFGD
jgi:hypothetical protein